MVFKFATFDPAQDPDAFNPAFPPTPSPSPPATLCRPCKYTRKYWVGRRQEVSLRLGQSREETYSLVTDRGERQRDRGERAHVGPAHPTFFSKYTRTFTVALVSRLVAAGTSLLLRAPGLKFHDDEIRDGSAEITLHSINFDNQNVPSVILNDPHFKSGEFGRDEELTSATIVPEPVDGTAGETTHTHRLDKWEDWDDSKSGIQEELTECERRLKHILMRSQLFLKTAKELFKLYSPAALLHVSDENSLGYNEKLILDCGYEIMERKGRRQQELAVHPFMKISVAFVRVRTLTLDDLVKQLNRNFDQLKLHGRDGNPECEVEYYLEKMLEEDVCVDVGDRDTNCTWDFGWTHATLAFPEKDDLVRDLESLVIRGLIDEIF